jgi:hypothetical protein
MFVAVLLCLSLAIGSSQAFEWKFKNLLDSINAIHFTPSTAEAAVEKTSLKVLDLLSPNRPMLKRAVNCRVRQRRRLPEILLAYLNIAVWAWNVRLLHY